ncbi:MAG: hypothetical protein OHK0046_27970 [Anaerolineae bacterium]
MLLNQHKHIENAFGTADSIEPKAARLFEKMVKRSRKPAPMYHLEELHTGYRLVNQYYGGVHAVALEDIRGTMNRTGDFDVNFRPIQRHTETRWLKVATAMLRGMDLPPIELVRVGNVYFVKDGHHRISVARALGYKMLDAVVEVWELTTDCIA